jgi:hypothetical protein
MTTVTAAACKWHEDGGGGETAQRCLDFLERVGIEVDWLGEEEGERLLDGLAIVEGRILIDPEVPVWPSDLLHEGGHVAVCPPEQRATLGPLVPDPVDEMMAIGWSYAASRECDVTLAQLFHSGGYRTDGPALRQSFSVGACVGVPFLEQLGMCTSDLSLALAQGVPTYPGMIRWLR